MVDKIGFIPLQINNTITPKVNTEMGAADLTKQFGSFLNDAMSQLNVQQDTVDKLNSQFVKGELSDVHQLMIANEKASLGLELTVQVRNKVIEAYQDIMRMQI